MSVDSWERFCEIEALMQPETVDIDPLDRANRSSPVDLEIGSDSAPSCVWCGEMVDSAHADARVCSTDCRQKLKAFRRRNPGCEPASA